MGRATTSLLGQVSHMEPPSLPIPGKSLLGAIPDKSLLGEIPEKSLLGVIPGKSTNFSLVANPLTPSMFSTQPAPAGQANGQSENFSGKKKAAFIPSTESWQGRTVDESERREKEEKSSPIAKWVAQVGLTNHHIEVLKSG